MKPITPRSYASPQRRMIGQFFLQPGAASSAAFSIVDPLADVRSFRRCAMTRAARSASFFDTSRDRQPMEI
jgi:hypothetical protein